MWIKDIQSTLEKKQLLKINDINLLRKLRTETNPKESVRKKMVKLRVEINAAESKYTTEKEQNIKTYSWKSSNTATPRKSVLPG